MAHDGDILEIKVFSNVDGHASVAMHMTEKQVNEYLRNYPAELVYAIHPQVTELVDPDSNESLTRYTVTVTLRA